MGRRFVAAAMFVVLIVPGFAGADPPAVALSLTGPSQFDPSIAVTFAGALTALDTAGIPFQPVDVLVDGSPVQSTTTATDGTYSVALTFQFLLPYTHSIRAVANRGTPLETSSPTLTITMKPQLQAINVSPTGLSLSPGMQAQYTAIGTYTDGSVRDITNEAMWMSDNTTVAQVIGQGFVKALVAGIAMISAHVGIIGAGTTLTVTMPQLVINEVDYDQPGTDTQEFIEIYNRSASPVSLDNVFVILINGANSLEYLRVPLTGTLPGFGYALVASSGTPTGQASVVVPFSAASVLQNGAPDGIALFYMPTLTMLDALSYEGSITTGVINGIPGSWNLVEGSATPAIDDGVATASLARRPNGNDTNNAGADWQYFSPITPGSPNP